MQLSTSQLEKLATSLQAKTPRGAERRVESRTPFDGKATIIPCGDAAPRAPITVAIRDFSASGIGISHQVPLPKGERFILILPSALASIAKGVLCSVAYSRPANGGFDIGATFISLVHPAPGPKSPSTPVGPTPSLPVHELIRAFRDRLKDVLSEEELAVIRSIERRVSATSNATATSPSGSPAQPADKSVDEKLPALAPRTSKEVQRILTKEQCIERAEKAMQARTLSGVVAQVISMAASPRSDLSDLASLVVRDPMLSARVLQAANSVSYASTRGVVSTIPEAVRNIGCAAVRDIASALGVFDAMPPSEADGFNPIRCWQHSFAVATLCQRLASESDSGPAYLVGLCHDLGEILFHSHFDAEYRQVLEAQQATGKRRDEVERCMLGITHGELVVTILRCLKLPDLVRMPIEECHATAAAGRTPSNPLARLLRLADLYANGVLLASSAQSPLHPLTRAECRAAAGDENPARPDGMSLRGEVFGLTAMLARLAPKAEAELMAPMYLPRSARVWLARDPTLSAFDPVTAAVESLAEVTVRETLPRKEELDGHAGVIVLSRHTSAVGFTAPEIAKAVVNGVPVLWLTGRVDGAANTSSLVPTAWPIPLGALAEFLQRLATAG